MAQWCKRTTRSENTHENKVKTISLCKTTSKPAKLYKNREETAKLGKIDKSPRNYVEKLTQSVETKFHETTFTINKIKKDVLKNV